MDVKMEKFTLITVFCFVIVYSSVAKAERLEISPNIYSGRLNPSWSIAKPLDAVKAEHFQRLVTSLMKLPKPPKSDIYVSGYNGFVIKHVLDNGETHSIEVAKCFDQTLETALLESAPLDIDPKKLSPGARKKIQEMIDACTQTKIKA